MVQSVGVYRWVVGGGGCYTPDGFNNASIEGVPLLEGLIQTDLSDVATHSCLSKLCDSKQRIVHSVRCPLCIHHLRVVFTGGQALLFSFVIKLMSAKKVGN